jgi:hypothetical protein
MMPAVGLTLFQNKQVTGSWTELPYALSRYQYGIPTTFTFQQLPVPHNPLTIEQQVDYQTQSETHGPATDTIRSYLRRLVARARFYRFFFLAPLYLVLPFFVCCLRELRFARVLAVIAILWIGTTFYPYFYPHYIAAATRLFVLMSVQGLRKLSQIRLRGFPVGTEAVQIILLLSTAHFLFWFGIHVWGDRNTELAATPYESWDSINEGDPEGRIAINRTLAKAPGKQLVFVHYSPQHGPYEWVHNAADIDRSRVVWALDLGPEDNAELRRYYPERKVWTLEADARPPRLIPLTP